MNKRDLRQSACIFALYFGGEHLEWKLQTFHIKFYLKQNDLLLGKFETYTVKMVQKKCLLWPQANASAVDPRVNYPRIPRDITIT